MDKVARQYLFQTLKQQRRRMTPAQRMKRPKSVNFIYPWAIERQYAAQISAWLQPLVNAVNKYIKEHGETMLRGDSVDLHEDATPGAGFKLLISTLQGWVGQYFVDPADKQGTVAVMMGLGRYADLTKWNGDKEWTKQMTSILGSEFTTSQSWWKDMKSTWTDNNYKLIKTAAEKYIGNINQLAESAIVNGYSYQTLTNDILKTGADLTGWQARRLARDQIGKLNGQITQNQNTEAGFDWYIWSTAGDKRVRTEPLSHQALNGKLCRWDDATVYSEDGGKTWIKRPANWEHMHPGQAIQCRCTAIPYIDDLLDEVDVQIDDEQSTLVEEGKRKELKEAQKIELSDTTIGVSIWKELKDINEVKTRFNEIMGTQSLSIGKDYPIDKLNQICMQLTSIVQKSPAVKKFLGNNIGGTIFLTNKPKIKTLKGNEAWGFYRKNDKLLAVGTGSGKRNGLDIGNSGNIGNGHIISVVTHEFGHLIYHSDTSLRNKWDSIAHIITESKNVGNVSFYAKTNTSEAFAESFSAYFHPEYNSGKKNKVLPSEIHKFFEENFGDKND